MLTVDVIVCVAATFLMQSSPRRLHYALQPVRLFVSLSVCPTLIVNAQTKTTSFKLRLDYYVTSNWQSSFEGGPRVSCRHGLHFLVESKFHAAFHFSDNVTMCNSKNNNC